MIGDEIKAVADRQQATGSTFTEAEKAEAARLAATFPKPPKHKRPMLLDPNVPEFLPAPEPGQYYRGLNQLAHARKKGDPRTPSINAVGAAIFYGWRANIRQTIEQIAKRAGVCSQTTQNVIAYLEPSGIFAPMNVMVRVNGVFRRAANLYLPCDFMLPAVRMARRVADQVLRFREECGKKLGLHWRTFGYNTTPLRQPGET